MVLPEYPRVIHLSGGIALIDTCHHGHPGTIGVYAVTLPEGGWALVETGPGVSYPELMHGFAQAGLAMAELRAVLLTHIHLDHAGGAGRIINETNATLYVHPVGARHMADPSRLLASAKRIYEDQMDALWGPMEPVPAERIVTPKPDSEFTVGGLTIRAVDTPGHASHHFAYLLPDGSLFTGDAAGILLPGSTLIRPAVPPPEIHIEQWEATLTKMANLQPSRLLLTHYGEVTTPAEHLALVPERHRAWANELLTGLHAGEDRAELIARMEALQDREFAEYNVPHGIRQQYRVTSNAEMTADGLARYWRKHRPERVNSE